MFPLQDLTVGGLIRHTTRLNGSCPAIWHNNKTWTYTELDAITDQMMDALTESGVHKGDHVGIWAEIEPEVVFVFYALLKMGAVAVMINTNLEREELTEMLIISDVKYLCVGSTWKNDRNLCAVCEALPELPLLREIISIGSGSADTFCNLAQLINKPRKTPVTQLKQLYTEVSPQDTAVILFTSGSTGKPKAVMSSHYSRVNNGIQQASDLGADCNDKFCVAIPFYHCFTISINIIAALASGACLCIPNDRRTSSILHTIETCGCTVLSSVPTMYRALICNKDFRGKRVSSLRTGIIGGANYPPEEFVRIEKELGLRLLSSLGQTECTAGLTICGMDDPLELRSRTVGRFMDHVEGKIADLKTGSALPAGRLGEICVRGYLAMQGYYRQPELTAEVIDQEGWLHTGDLGVMDKNGYITLCGRIRELIIRGGENISPLEIEEALLRLPQVKCCKAVGVPDSHYGEEICVCILKGKGEYLDYQTVKEHLSKHLAYYKVPRYILFWEEFPLTPTGKINLSEIKETARRELLIG